MATASSSSAGRVAAGAGQGWGEDTHTKRTDLDGPEECCLLAHSLRSMATTSTKM